MSLLTLSGVSSGYDGTTVLHDLDVSVESGSVVALLGRNGMGKTTTISTIAGLLAARSGRIELAGRDVTHRSATGRSRDGIGLVPETRRVFKSCTVREHLTLGARRRPSTGSPWTLSRIFDTFPVLRERARARGTELSGGEQQILAIARALSANPDLLLLDEPSEGLAPVMVREIAEVIRMIAAEQSSGAILLVEQNVPLALSIADRVLVMSQGEIVFSGSVAEYRDRPEIQARYIGVG
jgi:branched-chain amino acid transport system ATP-binding protein